MSPAQARHPDLILEQVGDSGPALLFIDPYLNASHRALARGLLRHLPARWTLLGMSGRFFRWRMRGGAAFLAAVAGDILRRPWDGLVASSMLNLAELKGLAPELASTPSVVVFHENQLAYPAQGAADQRQLDRDLFLALSNLTSAQAADRVIFNSEFQQNQFLAAGAELLAKLPDASPPGLMAAIAAKSRHLPIPLETGEAAGLARPRRRGSLRLVWNHRWHHDKDPQAFFEALFSLAARGLDFRVAVLGNRPARWPKIFDQAPARLGRRLAHLGPVTDRRAYWGWLFWADLAVSTALQENFGLAVAEAVWAGCRPLLPRAQVYPSLYPDRFLYQPGGLAQALAPLLAAPEQARVGDFHKLAQDFAWDRQAPAWRDALGFFPKA